MKSRTTLLCAIAAGIMTFAAGKALAFPLYLIAANGTITATAHYDATSDTTSNRFEIGAVNLKKIITLVSNEVFLETSGTNPPPADAKIAIDPFQFIAAQGQVATYLTNSSGYYYNLFQGSSHIVRFTINNVATSFRGTSNGGTENDIIFVRLTVSATGPDGEFYDFDIRGSGTLIASLNGQTGIANVTISLSNGSGFGEWKSSDDGVSKGGFTLKGSGVPAVAEPYSVFWWNNQP